MSISLIIPAYRQEKTIYKDIFKIKKILETIDPEYEIVVVVDGKVDETEKQALRHHSGQVKVLYYPNNQGKGFAVRYGMIRAKADIVAFIDAGLKINPEGLRDLYLKIKSSDADIIIGSKRHPESRVNYPFKRRFYSLTYQILVKVLFGLKIKDSQTGLKLFKKSVVATLLPHLTINRYAFDIEILTVANHFGFKQIIEAPIEVTYRPLTSISLKTAFRMLSDTLLVFLKLKVLRSYKKPLKSGRPSRSRK